LLLAAVSLQAQEVETSAPVDSLLLGKSIFTVMGPGVKVDQSSEVRQAMTQYVGKNSPNPFPVTVSGSFTTTRPRPVPVPSPLRTP